MNQLDKKSTSRIDLASRATMFTFSGTQIILAVCLVQIRKDLGLSLFQMGILGSAPSIMTLCILFSSVFFASKISKLTLIRIALIIKFVCVLFFSQTRFFWLAIAILVVESIASGILEGLLTPLIEDLHPNDSGKKMNLMHAFWPLGTMATVILAGEVLTRGISWRYLYIGLAVCVIIVFFLYPPKAYIKPSGVPHSHLLEIISSPIFWLMGMALFFAGGAEGAFSFWTAGYIQLHFKAVPRLGGFAVAIFALGMAVGRMLISHLADRIGLKKLLMISAGFALVISGFFFMINSIWALLLFLFLIGLGIAGMWPSIQSWAVRLTVTDHTLLMILLSCFGVPGIASATFLMGLIGEKSNLQNSFIVVPIYLALIVVMFNLAIYLHNKKNNSTR